MDMAPSPGGPVGSDRFDSARRAGARNRLRPWLDTTAMIRFEDLVDKVRANTPDADIELLRRAYVFSALEHKGQVRHSGEPYLVHPLEVASLLADMKLDVVAVGARLLPDVVRNTLPTPERRAEAFGPQSPPAAAS